VKRSEYVKQANIESYHNYIQGSGDLLGLEEESKGNGDTGVKETSAIDELLGVDLGTGGNK